MKDRSEMELENRGVRCTEEMEREIRRAGARLRHFRGVAASVMGDAQRLWREIWDELQDPHSCEDILEGTEKPMWPADQADRARLLEKLQLLGIQIDYARRLCEGSIGNTPHEKGDQ